MKRYIATSLLALTCLLLSAQTKEKWTGLSRYATANDSLLSVLRAAPVEGERVVLLGNSITDFWPAKHPEFFQEHPNIIARGISGQTSYQMLVRFREDVIQLKPDVVVINAGINDIAENQNIPYNEELTLGNLITMTELAQAHRIRVILTAVMPADHIYWNKNIQNVQDKIASLNHRISDYALEHRLAYIDYYTPMVFGSERAMNPTYTTDGLHPQLAGYQIMERLLLEKLNQ